MRVTACSARSRARTAIVSSGAVAVGLRGGPTATSVATSAASASVARAGPTLLLAAKRSHAAVRGSRTEIVSGTRSGHARCARCPSMPAAAASTPASGRGERAHWGDWWLWTSALAAVSILLLAPEAGSTQRCCLRDPSGARDGLACRGSAALGRQMGPRLCYWATGSVRARNACVRAQARAAGSRW
jgi:hypothetical protein